MMTPSSFMNFSHPLSISEQFDQYWPKQYVCRQATNLLYSLDRNAHSR